MPQYSYECPKGHEYDEVLSVSNYQKETKCPKCGKIGKKVIQLKQSAPTFTDKLYPYWDKGLNKVFNSPSDRKSYLKSKGLEEKSSKGYMTKQQERMMYQMRLGNHDPRDRRYAK